MPGLGGAVKAPNEEKRGALVSTKVEPQTVSLLRRRHWGMASLQTDHGIQNASSLLVFKSVVDVPLCDLIVAVMLNFEN